VIVVARISIAANPDRTCTDRTVGRQSSGCREQGVVRSAKGGLSGSPLGIGPMTWREWMRVRFVRALAISFMVAGVVVLLGCLGIAFTVMPEIAIVGIVCGPGLVLFGWRYLGRLPYAQARRPYPAGPQQSSQRRPACRGRQSGGDHSTRGRTQEAPGIPRVRPPRRLGQGGGRDHAGRVATLTRAAGVCPAHARSRVSAQLGRSAWRGARCAPRAPAGPPPRSQRRACRGERPGSPGCPIRCGGRRSQRRAPRRGRPRP
jgi:hypothetical protein